ncbi:MAG: rod shape-determining protein MreC [Flavobacteriales bacterium]|nr:rod shape-determining protein MreC [Flavobacteriales bacterium]
MQNLFKLIGKFGFVLLFILLEAIAFILVVRRSNYHRVIFSEATSEITGNFFKLYSNTRDYFKLRAENELLAEENARLRAEVQYSKSRFYTTNLEGINPIQAYTYIPCKVINNSTRYARNFFTIDAGKMHGIKPDMGVISPNGIAGVVRQVSDRFAVCISVLNTSFPVSVQLRKSKDYGSLEWDAVSPLYSTVKYIPTHVAIEPGDTLETSAYSSIYPEGIDVGVIESFTINPDDGYYIIKVRLTTRFTALRQVYAVDYHFRKEQDAIEDSIKNERQ